MAIWVGQHGGVKIERGNTEPFFSSIRPSDVDPTSKRFGLEKNVANVLITGDRVEITRVDEQGTQVNDLLDFVAPSGWSDNSRHSDGVWFCSVDFLGAVRLFDTWEKSLANKAEQAISLTTPSESYRLRLRVQRGGENSLGRTISWALNTNREVADITSLGEGFEKRMATLVSGSGNIDCFFDILPDFCKDGGDEEFSAYLHSLALRLEIGSTFTGVFLIKQANCNPLFNTSEVVRRRELFYTCDCVITEVGIEVNAEDFIESKIGFVTTGEIKLLYGIPSGYLLQETLPDDSKILQESDFGVLLELPE